MTTIEPSQTPPQAPAPAKKKEPILPMVGILLMGVGLGGSALAPVLMKELGDGSGRLTDLQRILALGTDLARLAIVVGLTLLIIGLLRSRQAK